ncbi:MAG: tetrahydrofolate dehydrogenase/cyclohydrolase catalytic domain-containing protein [Candidatus Dormiibacterota bacterium]
MAAAPTNLVDLGPLLIELREQLAGRVQTRKRAYRLGVVVEEGNVAGGSFARSLEREAVAAGVEVVHRTVPRDTAETTLTALDALVVDPTVNGVVVVQPVKSLPAGAVAAHLPASKDVEAVTPAALSAAAEGRRRGTPVAEACLATLVHLGIDCARARILVVGHGSTGGRPIAQRLLATGAQVSVIQSDIAQVDPLPPYDVLISAIGIAEVMPRAAIRPGTTVLDVGTSMVHGELRGDVSAEAGSAAARVTPVPGGIGRITAVCALLSLTELGGLQPGPVASWSLLEAVARMLSPQDAAGGAAAAAITGALAAALDGLCRLHGPAEEISESGQAAVRLLLSADRDRLAFGEYQKAKRQGATAAVVAARLRALATPGEIAEQLHLLELRLRSLETTPSLDLDRRLALELTVAAREAVTRLQAEFSSQPS